jgi:biotin transport system substrate-specific component
VIGMVYLKIMMHYDWLTAFNIGFLPFVPLDALKAVVAAQVIPAFKKVMRTEE